MATPRSLATIGGTLHPALPATRPYAGGPNLYANLMDIATKTWACFSQLLCVPSTGLAMNNVTSTGYPFPGSGPWGPSYNAPYTSGTEMGSGLLAVVCARDLGIITNTAAIAFLQLALASLNSLPTWGGLLYRWYDPVGLVEVNGAASGPINPPTSPADVSAVDHAWCAIALVIIRNAFTDPTIVGLCNSMLAAMEWDLMYDVVANQLNITFHTTTWQDSGGVTHGPQPAGDYQQLYAGPRCPLYLAIASGLCPTKLWYGTKRCPTRAGWTTSQTVTYTDPSGAVNPATGTNSWPVVESSYTAPGTAPRPSGIQTPATWPPPAIPGYPGGFKFVPTFGGSCYEAFAPSMVFPEAAWATNSFKVNNFRTAVLQAWWATSVLGLPVWGMAPATDPCGSGNPNPFGHDVGLYAQFGMALNTQAQAFTDPGPPNGAASNQYQGQPQYGIAPYASALCLPLLPGAASANLWRLQTLYPGLYTPWGFLDAVEPVTGAVAPRYMAVSQTCVIQGIRNTLLGDGGLPKYFAADPYAALLQPLLAQEVFNL